MALLAVAGTNSQLSRTTHTSHPQLSTRRYSCSDTALRTVEYMALLTVEQEQDAGDDDEDGDERHEQRQHERDAAQRA